MKKVFFGLFATLFISLPAGIAQANKNYGDFPPPPPPPPPFMEAKAPKLVIGIVVDQMKWEYLNKFRKSSGGLGRLLQRGFECSNTHLNYIPTVTAAGHSAIYTGAVPAVNGIIGNNWFERKENKSIYCTDDKEHGISPENLWSSTVTDELKLYSNFKSKVYGVSLKDRGAVLPAGHAANAAFWWNAKTGKWETSSYYAKEEADWIARYDVKSAVDEYYKKGWTTLLPIDSYENKEYVQADYVDLSLGGIGFPHKLDGFVGKDYSKVLYTPEGNEMTANLATKIIAAKKLGTTPNVTDFLAVSFSSTDYVGHAFGPYSVEREDIYLRLDQTLGRFIDSVEKMVGREVVFFLTADHGIVGIPEFLQSKNLPAQALQEKDVVNSVNHFGKQLGIKRLVLNFINEQIYLNYALDSGIGTMNRDEIIEKVNQFLLDSLGEQIIFAVNNHNIGGASLPQDLKEKVANGYSPTRSGDISLIYKAGFTHQYHPKRGTTHFTPYKYDTHIPLLFYGINIPQGKRIAPTHVTDIAVTISYLLGIPAPNASSGSPIEEIIQRRR